MTAHSLLNRLIDLANALPLPQVIPAYPLDWASSLLSKGSRMFVVPVKLANGNTNQWSGLQIERLLAAKGVRMWGRMVSPRGDIAFTVKATQANWTARILYDAGIEYQ